MTKQELHEKYKNLPPRDEMSREQERELVKDLFDIYEQEGFSRVFWDRSGDYERYDGQSFKVIGRVEETSDTIFQEQNEKAALEMLPMWRIKFEDDFILAAYPDEIIPSVMKDNDCPEEYFQN